ncbi:MAG: putative DNA-binding protein [Bacilli bacterium]
MLEKTTRMNNLFDCYATLLTPKQQTYMSLYYEEDHSLGEIAEHFSVSRQAVYDNIKRTEEMLEAYEEKLHLFAKYMQSNQLLAELRTHLTHQAYSAALEVVDALEKLE